MCEIVVSGETWRHEDAYITPMKVRRVGAASVHTCKGECLHADKLGDENRGGGIGKWEQGCACVFAQRCHFLFHDTVIDMWC